MKPENFTFFPIPHLSRNITLISCNLSLFSISLIVRENFSPAVNDPFKDERRSKKKTRRGSRFKLA